MLVNDDKVFVLFSIAHGSFNPALVGVFSNSKVAAETEKKLHLKNPNHTTSFILELPLCHTMDEYTEHWKTVLAKQVLKKWQPAS